jgi:hypothetical protein
MNVLHLFQEICIIKVFYHHHESKHCMSVTLMALVMDRPRNRSPEGVIHFAVPISSHPFSICMFRVSLVRLEHTKCICTTVWMAC